MLTRLIILLLLMVVAGFLASFVTTLEGEAIIEMLGYRIEIKTSLLTAILVVLVVLIVAMDRILTFIVTAPMRLRQSLSSKRTEEGIGAVSLGLIATAVGDGVIANKHAKRARRLMGDTTLTKLLDAQIATIKGDTLAASRFFENLSQERATAYLGHAGAMRLKAEAGDDEAALKAGRAAFAINKREANLARALFVLEAKRENWQEAIKALNVVRKLNKDEVSDRVMAVLHLELAHEQKRSMQDGAALRSLEAGLGYSSGLLPAVLSATEIYEAKDKLRKAAPMLEKAFLTEPHPALAEALMRAWSGTDTSNFARLMRLADKGGNMSVALTSAASVGLRLGLWGESRRLLEMIPHSERNANAWFLLAEVARHPPSGESTKDWPERENCLNAAALAPRPPAWSCQECGTTQSEWHSTCPQCESFASLIWR